MNYSVDGGDHRWMNGKTKNKINGNKRTLLLDPGLYLHFSNINNHL